jgi:class 3 adenylate cyclase
VTSRRAYLARLLCLPLLDLGVTGIFILITSRYDVIGLVAGGLALLGFSIVAIGTWLYRPIARFERDLRRGGGATPLDTQAVQTVMTRIRRLPWYSAIAAFVLTLIYSFTAAALRVYTPQGASLDHIDTLTITQALLWYSTAFGIFYAYFIYFVVNDHVISIRRQYQGRLNFALPDIPDSASAASSGASKARAPLMRKLAASFIVIGIMPALMVGLDLTIFAPIRQAQGLSMDQLIALDLFFALFVIVASIVFVSRSLLVPTQELYLAQEAVRAGDLAHRAAILTDDELGEVAGRFNLMVDALRERELIRSALNRYLTPSVADELISHGGMIEPRRLEATVMFTDIDGFTRISETLDPQDTIMLLNDYFALLSRLIAEAGGTVNNFVGDAIVAIFNVPILHEAHAKAAIEAAIAIQHAVAETSFVLADGSTLKLPTRIGINTGIVCAGTVGSSDRQGYTVYGDAVNLAARIEPLNKKFDSRILASARTLELASAQGLIHSTLPALPPPANSVVVRALGEVAVAGRANPVTIFAIET